MRILLFGKDGLLGWELARSLAPLGEVVALGRGGRDGLCGDFLRPESVAATVSQLGPALVVNAAAFTGVDAAERERHAAAVVNATAPGHIARAAEACGARMLHFSTEQVFDGTGDRPWTVADTPLPVNHYGRTKLEGEREVARHCTQALVVRTSWLHGARRPNSITRVLEQALAGEPLAVVDDQVGTPTSASLVADLAAHMVRAWSRGAGVAGIVHAAAAGETTRHGCALFVLAQATQLGVLPAGLPVRAVNGSHWPTAARRPANGRLDTAHLRTAFGVSLPPWQDGVARTVQEFAQAHPAARPGGWT